MENNQPIIIALITFFITLTGAIIFSLAEHSFSKLDARDIRWLRAKNDKRSKRLLKILQSGVNFVASFEFWKLLFVVSLIFISSFTILLLSQQFLENNIPFIITFVIVFLLTFVFVFLVPKIYADNHVIIVARAVTPYVYPFERIAGPFFRFPEDHQYNPDIIEEENTPLSQEERGLYERIINFPYKSVRNILTPRMDIKGLALETSYTKLLEEIDQIRHSRVPIYEGGMENIVGILYAKDLIPFIHEKNYDWHSLLHKPLLVTPDMHLNDLLEKFKKNRIHLATVIDEYGGCLGIVTLEDVLEVVLGDIQDEYDDEEVLITRVDASQYVVDPKVSLEKLMEADDRFRTLFKGYESKKVETLNGYIIEEFNELPQAGQEIDMSHATLHVDRVATNRITQVSITLK